MASYKAVQGVMIALEDFFTQRFPSELNAEPTSAKVKLLGSADISDILKGNILGIYLHRITIDPHGRARSFAPKGTRNEGHQTELPVNLHFLLIANAKSATVEADLMSWAMLQLANESQLDVSQLRDSDSDWGEQELVTITPDEMSTEDLMRIWDVFKSPYTSTVPYIARTVRLRLNPPRSEGPAVVTRVFPGGRL